MSKRILLFILTNILVIATISIITSVLGLHSYLSAHGLDYAKLAVFCAIWGMAGSFISLMMSKFIAKSAMGVVVINPQQATPDERLLVEMVYGLARKAGLITMPEVGIYSSPEVNAFATGPSRNNSLVAVSSGMLNSMNRDEIEGVLGHEVSHVANGDMVTMTLLQGVINAFALFFSRVIAYAASTAMSRNDERSEGVSGTYYIISMVLDVLFTVLGSIVVAAFSRYREFRADHGGATLAGRERMIAALRRLERASGVEDESTPSLDTLKISHHPSWLEIFSTHPPLAVRIQRLQQGL